MKLLALMLSSSVIFSTIILEIGADDETELDYSLVYGHPPPEAKPLLHPVWGPAMVELPKDSAVIFPKAYRGVVKGVQVFESDEPILLIAVHSVFNNHVLMRTMFRVVGDEDRERGNFLLLSIGFLDGNKFYFNAKTYSIKGETIEFEDALDPANRGEKVFSYEFPSEEDEENGDFPTFSSSTAYSFLEDPTGLLRYKLNHEIQGTSSYDFDTLRPGLVNVARPMREQEVDLTNRFFKVSLPNGLVDVVKMHETRNYVAAFSGNKLRMSLKPTAIEFAPTSLRLV